jgi:hypothetical protein
VDGCIAYLECRIISEPHNQQQYDLFIGEVLAAGPTRMSGTMAIGSLMVTMPNAACTTSPAATSSALASSLPLAPPAQTEAGRPQAARWWTRVPR